MLTLGHSTLPIDIFLHALQENNVKLLVDVRTVPRSRHNPQFATEELAKSLRSRDIEYRWMQSLGGLRHTRKDSINTGWRNASFRGYADYMQTDAFADALNDLMTLDEQTTAAVMCAEAVPWRCHRSLIADALLVHKHPVEHIFVTPPSHANPMGSTHRKPHTMTAFAQTSFTQNGELRLWYPDPQELPWPEENSERNR